MSSRGRYPSFTRLRFLQAASHAAQSSHAPHARRHAPRLDGPLTMNSGLRWHSPAHDGACGTGILHVSKHRVHAAMACGHCLAVVRAAHKPVC